MIAKPIMLPPFWCVSQCVAATTILFVNVFGAFGPDCTSSGSSEDQSSSDHLLYSTVV